ncbi:hypothetical protein EJ08DRAFT_654151 [Tothia fuscella]|uniref:Structure-specific endonuclease subunit SLX4 n=1 Tax=Tothia fuscella TaxID=1048955 RepID=A0A9P4NFP9_9PEZI|nr:hypothetical protein EJ08DRAFT_654151 [Tothia fuscella]
MALNLVILPSSSPPEFHHEISITPPGARSFSKTPQKSRFEGITEIPNSSSSNLPSPTELMGLRDTVDPRLKTGSRAAAIPHGANFGFRNVAGMVNARRLSIGRSGEEKKDGSPVKPAIKPRGSKDEEKTDGSASKTKKMKADAAEIPVGLKKPRMKSKDTGLPAPKKPRKTAAKKEDSSVLITSVELSKAADEKLPVPSKKRKRKPVTTAVLTEETNQIDLTVEVAVEPAKKSAKKPRKKTGAVSAHFDTESASKNVEKQVSPTHATKAVDQDVYTFPGSPKQPSPQRPIIVAPKRKNDWTPAKETSAHTDVATPDHVHEPVSPLDKATRPSIQSFSTIGGNFSFGPGARPATSSVSPCKTSPGVGLNKRRKIELIGNVMLAESETTADVAPKEASPKKKPSKKKPFSITRQATEKYQVQPPPKPLYTEKTSNFFASPVFPERQPESPQKSALDKAVQRQPKSRTSRKKAAESAKRDTGKSKKDSAKKDSAKSKKSTTKTKPVVVVNKLLSPTNAAKKLQGQDIIFGTSSQLVTETSPNQLRQLQQAIRESSEMAGPTEEVDQSSRSGLRHSMAALARNGGGLWGKAAEPVNIEDDVFVDRPMSPSAQMDLDDDEQETVSFPVTQVTDPDFFEGEMEQVVGTDGEGLDAGLIMVDMEEKDIPYFGPLPELRQQDADSAHVPAKDLQAHLVEETGWHDVDDLSPLTSLTKPDSDALPLKSGGKGTQKQIGNEDASHLYTVERHQTPNLAQPSGGWSNQSEPNLKETHSSSPLPAVASLIGTALRPLLPDTSQRDRTALRPVSTNTKIKTTARVDEPQKKTKKVTVVKDKKATSIEQGALPAKKPRGRPQKAKQSDETKVTGSTNPATTIATTPTKNSRAPGAENGHFADIDEIEDSEPDRTPSPPLQRRTKSKKSKPPPLPELVSGEAHVDADLPTTKNSRWPLIQAILFPQITNAIKANPPSKDITRPSWNEKIALYDPIVIEDLTAWINENGIRIRNEEKDKDEDAKGWMVQKWCEEHSVTCMWKEGLRGGVRTHY